MLPRLPFERSLLCVLLFIGFSSGAVGQELPVQIDLDVAVFAYDESSSLVEIYLAFEAASLQFGESADGFTAILPLDLAISHSSAAALPDTPVEPVWSDSMNLTFVVTDTSGFVQGQHFLHQIRAAIPPGEYEMNVVVLPSLKAESGQMRMRRDVVVPSFANSTEPAISDITLATHIERSEDAANPFYKNGLSIRPNANQLYGEGLSRLFYYAESYNVDDAPGVGEEYEFFCYIAEANLPKPLPEHSRRLTRPSRSPDVIVGSFDVANLPSGSYFLRMVVLNRDNQSVVEQARKFFVYNPSVQRQEPIAVTGTFETSIFATMPEEDVGHEIELISIIASDRENRRGKSIRVLDEKRRFLMEFWSKRDPNPNSPENAYREEFFQRVQYANDRYTNSFKEGWKTDRGRVLLKHGLPSGIDPHLYDRDTAPYEVWEYNNIPGEGQAVFVFADRAGFGQFDLIHSTVTGETTLPDWREELRRR